MKLSTTDNFEKKIKKNLYGKPQAVIAMAPPGFIEVAKQETHSILSNLWFPQKWASDIVASDNEILIKPIHLFAATELMLRSHCLTDIRIVIGQGKTASKFAFEQKCQTIPWEFFFNQQMKLRVKVDSIASRAFHENALKEILSDIVKAYVAEIVSHDEGDETTTLYAKLYKNKLTLSLSLAGQPLYKRGFRETLSAIAPLREDMAAACIRKLFTWAGLNEHQYPDNILVPFSGTGTFVFEYIQNYFNCSSVLLNRQYALEQMSFFRIENFNFLIKKAYEACLLPRISENQTSLPKQNTTIRFICIDSSAKANDNLLKNKNSFLAALNSHGLILPTHLFLVDNNENSFFQDDFLKWDFSHLNAWDLQNKVVFIPLNPPYGIRINKQMDPIIFYQKIAKKLNELKLLFQKQNTKILGFIFCPSEATWLTFSKHLKCVKSETYHFMQGGLDIRVFQFII